MNQKNTIILGISCYYHDSAAALMIDGEIIAAAQEERFSRIKGDSSFPHQAINYCLNEAKISLEEITHIAFYENYLQKFERILISAHLFAPFGLKNFLSSMPKWLTTNLWLENKITTELGIKKNIIFFDHHLSHAASAFYPSPFRKAAILTIDGVGEWSTTTYGIGFKNDIELKKEIRYPNSIGLLYSAFTYYTGFKINGGEYKLMGLAPYGQPIYVNQIKDKLVKIFPDGSIELNQSYFNYNKGLTMTNKKFNNLFGGPPRQAETNITQKEMDLAASIQVVLNEIILKLANTVYQQTKCKNLVLAGGVALNVVAIGELERNSKFKNIWVQPASGDAGGALGAAFLIWHQLLNKNRNINKNDQMKAAFLGPKIEEENSTIDCELKSMGAKFDYFSEKELVNKIANCLAKGKILAIARDRMEFGPRALGHRSILGDARVKSMQATMNLKIKFRESFRPFAPIVLAEDANKYFEIAGESPYMLKTYYVKKRRRITFKKELFGLALLNIPKSDIPAVTHIDYSARIQTIDQVRNPFIYQVLKSFKKKTSCSVLINTSFNVRGEPIVDNEINSYRCFMNTKIDYLVVGNRFFDKSKQNQNLYKRQNIKKEFALD